MHSDSDTGQIGSNTLWWVIGILVLLLLLAFIINRLEI